MVTPEDRGERLKHGAEVVYADFDSFGKANRHLAAFSILPPPLVPDASLPSAEQLASLAQIGKWSGEGPMIGRITESVAHHLRDQDGMSQQETLQYLQEHLTFIWQTRSGEAHSNTWQNAYKTDPGSDFVGDLVADFGIVVALCHLAVDRLKVRTTTPA